MFSSREIEVKENFQFSTQMFISLQIKLLSYSPVKFGKTNTKFLEVLNNSQFIKVH